jgi:SAM-dependent methyltransferase
MDRVESRWGDAEFTHSLTQASWMTSIPVLMHLNERVTGDPARDWLSAWAPRYFAGHAARVLVLGCGEGWLERAIADWPFVASIDALDLAAEALERASASAPPKVHYRVADLNRELLEPDGYDVVIAHMILHHVERLEHVFDQIERAMKPDATLIFNEYTGPKRFQFGDDILGMMNALRKALGKEPVIRPTEEFMIENDPSEAVRSDELLPMLFERFEVLEEKRLGGTLLQHVLYQLPAEYRFENARERSIVDLLCTFEGALVDAQAIPSDFNVIAARKRGSNVRPVSRPLPPRPDAAKNVDPDPLRMRSRRRTPAQRPGTLQPWHMRLLRIALASTQERRANLFAEQPMHSAMERFRFAVGNTSAFDWITSRYLAYGDDRVILDLLATFDTLAPQ